MRIYFKQEMKYHYDRAKPLDDFPAYLIAMGEHCGFQFYVKNLNGRYPTAYVQVPSTHPMYGNRLKDIDPLARAHYLVDTGKHMFFAVPNPECFYGMFCKIIRDLALGKYKDQFEEKADE